MLYSVLTSLTLRMSAATAAVLLIKWVFGTKISAKGHNLLWLIPLIQLFICLFDIKIPSKVSVYNYAAAIPSGTAPDRSIFVYIWLAGILVTGLWYTAVIITHYIKLKKLPDCKESYQKDAKLLGINKIPVIKCGENPACFGKYIVVPENCNRFIALHELSHYKGNDCLKMRCAITVLCINWFNPIMWLAYKMFIADIEMLCDERLLNVTDDKKAYAGILVNESSRKTVFAPGATFVHTGKHELMARLRRIAAYGKKRPVWIGAFVVVFICAGALLLTDRENEIAHTPTQVTVTEWQSPQPTVDAAPRVTPAENVVIEWSTPKPNSSPQKPTTTPKATAKPKPAASPISAPAENVSITEMEIGTSKAEIYERAGAPESVSANGSREIYTLDDGSQAVLQYNGDTLENAYILEN